MKTLYFKETLAWIALLCAIVLFTFTVSFAQSKTDGKVRIHIEKDVNGKTEMFDTTFTSTNPFDFNSPSSFVITGNPPFPFHLPDRVPNPDPLPPPGFRTDTTLFQPDASKRISAEIEISLKKEMEAMQDEMKNFDSGLNDDSTDGITKKICIIMNGGDAGDKRIIIKGSEDEEAPVLEKEIDRDGHKEFIYKRMIIKDKTEPSPAKKADAGINALPTEDLKIYLNPGDGQFTLNFHADAKGDLRIRVMDINGKELFTQQINDFSGDYSKLVDLSDKGKGIYIVSVEQDQKQLSRRIVFN